MKQICIDGTNKVSQDFGLLAVILDDVTSLSNYININGFVNEVQT